MSRLYESSTDYEEHITYAGNTVEQDYDNPDYLYDREQLTYEGTTANVAQGYASTALTYSTNTTGYNGSRTLDTTATGTGTGTSTAIGVRIAFRTATGDGTGTSTATGLHVAPRTATGDGTGTSTTTGLHIAPRTATGNGTGTSNNAILHKLLRTAYGSGGASTGDSATGLHIAPRTATGEGDGTSAVVQVRTTFATGSATGAGTSTANGLRIVLRTATGSGDSTQTASGLHIAPRTATGTGTGTATSIGARFVFRAASNTGNGADIPATWTKSFIFRPPVEADFPWANYHSATPANRLFSRLTPGERRLNVYKLSDGTYTSIDPRNDNAVVKIYFGSHENFVTAEEKADLVAAGYDVT